MDEFSQRLSPIEERISDWGDRQEENTKNKMWSWTDKKKKII